MKETRKETIRQAWDRTLQFPNCYPDILEGFPNYAREAVAKSLRKKTKSWRLMKGFPKEFSTLVGYFYGEDLEVEVEHVRR